MANQALQYFRSRASQGAEAPVPASLTGAGEPLAAATVAYPPEVVPDKAKDAVKWINAAADDRDRTARAEIVAEVEQARDKPRGTVTEAVDAILNGS